MVVRFTVPKGDKQKEKRKKIEMISDDLNAQRDVDKPLSETWY